MTIKNHVLENTQVYYYPMDMFSDKLRTTSGISSPCLPVATSDELHLFHILALQSQLHPFPLSSNTT